MYSLYILSSVYFLWLKTTSKNPLWYEIFFNLITFFKIAFTCTYACVYRPHGCAFVHWSKCLPFIAYSRDKKKLTPGLTGTFHFFHSRPFVPILGGAWAWMQIFFLLLLLIVWENYLFSPTCSVCFHFCSRASNMTLHSSWTSCCCQAKSKSTKKEKV